MWKTSSSRPGKVVRGRIGVTIQDVNAQLAESFGLDRPRGALVSSVEKDGPAAKAGLQPGDVILARQRQADRALRRVVRTDCGDEAGRGRHAGCLARRQEANVDVKVTELKEQQQTGEAGRQAEGACDQPGQPVWV